MATAENDPGAAVAVAELQVWDSYVVLSPLNSTRPTDEQINLFQASIAGPVETGKLIRSELEVSGEQFSFWGFSLELNAPSDLVAVEDSLAIVTRGLDAADVNFAELEFIDLHIAQQKLLVAEQKQSTELGEGHKVLISDAAFIARDALRLRARNQFYGRRDALAAISAVETVAA